MGNGKGVGLLGSAALVLLLPSFGAAAVCSLAQTAADLRIAAASTGPQDVFISDLGSSVVVSVDCNNDGDYLDSGAGDVNAQPFTGVETITVQLGGKDTIVYSQDADFTGITRELSVVLGPYANFITVTSSGHAMQAKSSLAVDLLGGPNLDTIAIDMSGATLDDSALLVYGDLGSGSDNFTVKAPQATNSRVDVDVALGTGNNVASLVADKPFSGSTFRTDLEGGDMDINTDAVSSRLAATFDNASRVVYNAYLRNGADTYDGAFDVSALKVLNGSDARFRVDGGPGNDALTVSDGGTAGAAQNDGVVEAFLRGGPGQDVVTLDWYGMTGTGTFRYRGHGGINADSVLSSFLTDAASQNNVDFAVQGGRGPDVVYSALFDASGTASYDPAGSTWLDGGFESDRCIAFGNGAIESLNCEQ